MSEEFRPDDGPRVLLKFCTKDWKGSAISLDKLDSLIAGSLMTPGILTAA